MLTSQEIDFVVETASPYLQDIKAIILGGSQVLEGGQLKVDASDNDIIVFAEQVTSPTSIAVPHPETGKKLDLILRDEETFAWNIHEEALPSGVGTLLHIAATGEYVGTPQAPFDQVKSIAQSYLKQGPFPVAAKSLTKRIKRLHADVAQIANLGDPAARLVAHLCLAHKVGITAARAQRDWVGKGKIMGRFLHERMPSLKSQIEEAFAKAAQDDGKQFDTLIHAVGAISPQPSPDTFPSVPFSAPAPSGFPRTTAAAFYQCRRNLSDCNLFLNCSFPPFQNVAQQWMQRKHKIVASAVDPMRIGRESNEYFYALARMTEMLMIETSFSMRQDPGRLPLAEQATLTAQAYPSLGQDLTAALAGEPQALLQHADKTLQSIAPTPCETVMHSPSSHRRFAPSLFT